MFHNWRHDFLEESIILLEDDTDYGIENGKIVPTRKWEIWTKRQTVT